MDDTSEWAKSQPDYDPDDLEWSNMYCRVCTLLDHHGIWKWSQLEEMTSGELAQLPGVGPKTVDHIISLMAERGAGFKDINYGP